MEHFTMNMTTVVVSLTVREVCEAAEIPEQQLANIVDQGIVEPHGTTPQDWKFDTEMVVMIRKAVRLHHDLEIDWTGVAVTIQLLDEVDKLRFENQQLLQRLARFMHE
jgi:chaperone modulatory protein CbpM